MDFDATNGDKINLGLYDSIPNFAALSGKINQAGPNVIVSLNGGDDIVLENTLVTDVDSSDFLF